jgi:hypothetical protein
MNTQVVPWQQGTLAVAQLTDVYTEVEMVVHMTDAIASRASTEELLSVAQVYPPLAPDTATATAATADTSHTREVSGLERQTFLGIESTAALLAQGSSSHKPRSKTVAMYSSQRAKVYPFVLHKLFDPRPDCKQYVQRRITCTVGPRRWATCTVAPRGPLGHVHYHESVTGSPCEGGTDPHTVLLLVYPKR